MAGSRILNRQARFWPKVSEKRGKNGRESVTIINSAVPFRGSVRRSGSRLIY